MPERFYGVRHHGPGSARAVLAALTEQRPDLLLIEGPPEADDLVRWVADQGLEPPVALLGYATDDPRRAAYWPFAVFSPEWQAIRWAVDHDVPVRFFDLPYAYRLGESRAGDGAELPEPETGVDGGTGIDGPFGDDAETRPGEPVPPVRPVDPIAELAAAAGYDDPERWWEDVVEHRGAPAFEAIGEAMAAIRAESPEDPDDLLREAYMRGVLREARKSHRNLAVVCGAWHVPALTATVPASHDNALLKGRRKSKVTFTWVPWTYGRLASWQGYGAGVRSPGWYHHLFTTQDEVVPRWLVAAAGVLRAEGVPTSSAHVIEAVRLAEALATIRGRPLAGLAELTEATRSVICEGDDLRLDLVDRQLVVGERLGAVPDDMPAVPLARDLAAQQRTLRLKPEALDRELDLDLRKEIDLGRSRLLHRLRLLGIGWGEPTRGRQGKGTFRETWRLRWLPEFAVAVVEAGAHGTTVQHAATTKITTAAQDAEGLAEVTPLVEQCLLADLTDAYPAVLRALHHRAALDADVTRLMAAVPPLARTLRYGDVRGTELGPLRTVTTGLLVRICVGLPPALRSLSDDAARTMRDHIDAVHAALGLWDEPEPRERWLDTLAGLAARDTEAHPGADQSTHGLVAGRLTRILHDAGRLDADETRRRMGLVLTPGTPPAQAAHWIEGFLAGGGLLFVHDTALLGLVDGWLTGIAPEVFTDVLPLLRRTFGAFAPPERRAIGERVRGDRPDADQPGQRLPLDHDRAAGVLPALATLLGHQPLLGGPRAHG
ncbi:DUF5682 family protein [Micromonospora sp. NPDC050417]|uniref:DUF5682 family protein n=1 Tax=Micromonospora sp. NPDC050417 TaxID=3364280 RepID=UPI0037AA9C53